MFILFLRSSSARRRGSIEGNRQTKVEAQELDVLFHQCQVVGKPWAIIHLHFCLPMYDQVSDGKRQFLFIIISQFLMTYLAWKRCLIKLNKWMHGWLYMWNKGVGLSSSVHDMLKWQGEHDKAFESLTRFKIGRRETFFK